MLALLSTGDLATPGKCVMDGQCTRLHSMTCCSQMIAFLRIGSNHEGCTYATCNKCSGHMRERWLKYAPSNNADPGYVVPPELCGLTPVETALIARVSAMLSYYYISETSTGYHKNVANAVQSVEEVVSKLPRAPATCGIVKVRLHGSKKSERDFKVRRVKVLEALLWLQANNPLYEDIRIDEEVLSSLPDDGHPRELRSCDEDDVPADASDAELSDESDNEFEPVDEGPQEASRARDQGDKPVFDRESGVITGMPVANERRMAAAHVKSAQEPADRSAGSA